MTLPIIGSSLGAQSSNQSIQATSDGNGNITFVGPSGIQGSTITCVATVPNAPPAALFTAMIGSPTGLGVALQTWLGGSTAGRFQMGVGQTLVVTGTGMAPNTRYTCTFAAIIDVGDVQVVLPEPNSSITGVAPSVAIFQFFASGGANQTFTIPANVSALTIDMAGAQGGNEPIAGTPGGKGARVQCTIAVVPGQVLTINVGKQAVVSGTTSPGGIGGHAGGPGAGMQAQSAPVSTQWGMGGGGSSTIANAIPTILAEAGGGGGASYSKQNADNTVYVAAGGAGGFVGSPGTTLPLPASSPFLTVAGGGTQVAGGAGGTTPSVGFTNGTAGTNIVGGTGGAGTSGGGAGTAGTGGGGGGGFFGGGGGTSGFFPAGGNTDTAAGSGGGASSTTAAGTVSGATFTTGFQAGDGYVTLSYVVL